MNAKSMMQTLNLGLSIFSKVQLIQHRNIKMAESLRGSRQPRSRSGLARNRATQPQIQDAEIVNDDHEI